MVAYESPYVVRIFCDLYFYLLAKTHHAIEVQPD